MILRRKTIFFDLKENKIINFCISYLILLWNRFLHIILLSIFYFASLVSLHFASFGVRFASALLFRFDEKQAKNSILFASQPHDFRFDFSCLLRSENEQRNLELCSRHPSTNYRKRSNYCRNPDNCLTSFPPCYSQSPLQKPNSWTYNFVEVSGHNLESSQTWGFHIQCLQYTPVSISNHFSSRG